MQGKNFAQDLKPSGVWQEQTAASCRSASPKHAAESGGGTWEVLSPAQAAKAAKLQQSHHEAETSRL